MEVQTTISRLCCNLASGFQNTNLPWMLNGPNCMAATLLNALPDQFYVKDLQSRFVFVNTAAATYLKKTPPEIVGKMDIDFFPSSLASQFLAEEKLLLISGQPVINREGCWQDANGNTRWELTTKVALSDETGAIIGLLGTNRDITDRRTAQTQLQKLNMDLARSQVELLAAYDHLKQTQAQLIQAEKLESIGRLTAGIAHEVRNPLATLLMGLGFLEDSLLSQQPLTGTVLNDMRDAVHRADAIICELLDFSSPRQLDLTDEAVSVLAERALVLVRHELGHRRIEIMREFTPDLPVQRVDRIRIEQVFVNLLINAIHAMPAGGQLTVRTGQNQTGAVMAEVCDTGPGIAPELLKKVFEPFFTTKKVGAGSGMGLAMAKTIMAQHGGDLTLTNQSKGGVCARIIFNNKKEADHGS